MKYSLGALILFTGIGSIIITALVLSCHRPAKELLISELDSISSHWVPDTREGICDVILYNKGRETVLKGETNILQAREAIVAFLKSRNIEFTDSLTLLPDTSLIKKPWGLVTISVCNIRPSPAHNTEMISQALMGTPVKILKYHRGWYLVQTPDSYIGWVDSEAVEPMDTDAYKTWKTSTRIIYVKKTGDILKGHGSDEVISDIVTGAILEVNGQEDGYFRITLPDGCTGFIKRNEAIDLDKWMVQTGSSYDDLVTTARSFTGIPYLWGGTSVKGFDCSGFVRIVYYLHGIMLARDASLQSRHGIRLGKTAYPDSLQRGDLMFFGSSVDGKPRPTHVGIYIGDTEFIHASGKVKVNSLDSTRFNFSRNRRDSFLGVRRIIGAEPEKGLRMISDREWYK